MKDRNPVLRQRGGLRSSGRAFLSDHLKYLTAAGTPKNGRPPISRIHARMTDRQPAHDRYLGGRGGRRPRTKREVLRRSLVYTLADLGLGIRRNPPE